MSNYNRSVRITYKVTNLHPPALPELPTDSVVSNNSQRGPGIPPTKRTVALRAVSETPLHCVFSDFVRDPLLIAAFILIFFQRRQIKTSGVPSQTERPKPIPPVSSSVPVTPTVSAADLLDATRVAVEQGKADHKRKLEELLKSVEYPNEEDARPWSREDYNKRLRSFQATTWPCKWKEISAVECARRGWICVGYNRLKSSDSDASIT